ncbi:MAG TPA: sigma factor-like helix-turn-helix DNA-binding protein [Solirubrobacteraceae bacterium]|jgi:hypothetical protein
MDEVYEYCVRMLGAGAVAIHASHEAFVTGRDDRLERLAGAVQACRTRAEEAAATTDDDDRGSGQTTLAESVAREVAAAASKLPSEQREALALADLVGLSHEEIARALAIDPETAGLLVARARLALRAARRGVAAEPDEACDQRGRALAIIVRRQDHEPVDVDDQTWLLEHLGSCESCARVHASMLEASVCYRAWRTPDPAATRPGARPRQTAEDAVGDAVP